jgi:hypothetical protein
MGDMGDMAEVDIFANPWVNPGDTWNERLEPVFATDVESVPTPPVTAPVVPVVPVIPTPPVNPEWIAAKQIIRNLDIQYLRTCPAERLFRSGPPPLRYDDQYRQAMAKCNHDIDQHCQVLTLWSRPGSGATEDQLNQHKQVLAVLSHHRDDVKKKQMDRLKQVALETRRVRTELARQNLIRQIEDARAWLWVNDMQRVKATPLWERLHRPTMRQRWDNPRDCLLWLVRHGTGACNMSR